MTITPISTYPRASARPPQSRSGGRSAVRASAHHGSDRPEWSLELDIRLRGEPDPAVIAILADLQRLLAASTQATPVGGEPSRAAVADITIDVLGHTVTVRGRVIEMTRLEFDLLLFLAENPGRVFTRAELLNTLWNGRETGTRTIDVHVRRLRVKTGRSVISTVRRVGYRLASDVHTDIVR